MWCKKKIDKGPAPNISTNHYVRPTRENCEGMGIRVCGTGGYTQENYVVSLCCNAFSTSQSAPVPPLENRRALLLTVHRASFR